MKVIKLAFSKQFVFITFFIIVVSVSVWIFLTFRVAIGLSVGALSVYMLYLSFQHDQKQAEKRERIHQQFLTSFRYFQVLIEQDLNAYQAIKLLTHYVEEPLHDQLMAFLILIDQDKSVRPYQEFAKTFQSIMIEQVMLGMYQLDQQGGKGMALYHFNFIFDQIEQQAFLETMKQHQERLQSGLHMAMIGTGIIAFTFLVGVVDLILGMLYGA